MREELPSPEDDLNFLYRLVIYAERSPTKPHYTTPDISAESRALGYIAQQGRRILKQSELDPDELRCLSGILGLEGDGSLYNKVQELANRTDGDTEFIYQCLRTADKKIKLHVRNSDSFD